MQRHFATLKSLDLSITTSDSSSMVQTIMESCPSLEEFTGNVIRAVDMIEGAPWVCSRLEKLFLLFVIDPNETTPGKTKKDQCRVVYTHLSGLSHLRLLYYKGWCNTLEDIEFVGRSAAALVNRPRYSEGLSFKPLFQGVRVPDSHFSGMKLPKPESFERNYD
ncbi:hypothetical protein BGX26_008367, partial [Mortierella sp. AD094]